VNLLLVEPDEVGSDGRVRLEGRRAKHLLRVLGVTEGQTLRAGVVGRGLGTARVVGVETGSVKAVEVVVVLWGPPELRFRLMTLEWPEEDAKVEGKRRLVLEDDEEVQVLEDD